MKKPVTLTSLRTLSLLTCLAALPAAASTFNISPIRAELLPRHRTEVLTLTNADEDAVVVQVHVVSWSQQDGEEQLEDTRELLVTPPVLQIAGKAEQIVRVALRREPDAAKELTYRVIFEEVPQAAPLNFKGLRVALRLSVPVFVAPARGRATADVSWNAHALPDGELEVAASNQGTGHLQISDFDVQSFDGTRLHGMTSKYLLPGSRMTWRLRPVLDTGGSGTVIHAPLVIQGRSDLGYFSADVALSTF